MVQKTSKKQPSARGRPRAYEPEVALKQATEAFWRTGYGGTSLGDITAATGMNKPSLYAAFGNKHALYLEALSQYLQMAFASMREAVSSSATSTSR